MRERLRLHGGMRVTGRSLARLRFDGIDMELCFEFALVFKLF